MKTWENHQIDGINRMPARAHFLTFPSFDGGSGASISQQDLLDIMIWSYKLSSHKIKAPHRLRIICKKNRGFSINNIDK